MLVEGDDLTEPLSDAARAVLDGHLVLSRRLAARGHYPALDLLESVSRTAEDVCDEHHRRARRLLQRLLAAHAGPEELIAIGAYARGADPDCDAAIALRGRIDGFLRQEIGAGAEYAGTRRAVLELAVAAERELSRRAAGAPS